MLLTKELGVASHGVRAALPGGGGGSAEGGGGPDGRRLGGECGADVRDEEFAYARPPGGVTGVLGCQVDPFAFAMLADVRLAEEQVGVAGESGEGGARSAVPGVGEDAPRALGAQPVGLDVVDDGGGGEGQAAVMDDLPVVQRPEVEYAAEETGVGAPEEPGEPPPLLNAWEVPPARSRPARGPGSARAG